MTARCPRNFEETPLYGGKEQRKPNRGRSHKLKPPNFLLEPFNLAIRLHPDHPWHKYSAPEARRRMPMFYNPKCCEVATTTPEPEPQPPVLNQTALTKPPSEQELRFVRAIQQTADENKWFEEAQLRRRTKRVAPRTVLSPGYERPRGPGPRNEPSATKNAPETYADTVLSPVHIPRS